MANPAITRRKAAKAFVIDDSGARLRLRDDAPLDWQRVADDDPMPEGGATLVPLARLGDALASNSLAAIGVHIAPDEDVRDMAGALDRLSLIELAIPIFKDGRAYSSARILRADLGFGGEIRVVGDVLADQVHFMRRVGVDSFILAPGVALETALRCLARYDAVYQASSDGRRPVWQVRYGD